jgi:hypothetical protein
VPAVQAALLDRLLAAIRRSGRTPRPSRLSVFFLVWAVLTLALIVTTLSISLAVFRSVDMTDVAIFSLVAVPALQACVLIEPIPGRRQWIGMWTAVMAHPLARPILWIDLIVLTTGVVLLQNPQVGLAWAPMQRHWAGTKLTAAAMFFARVGFGRGDAWRNRLRFGGLAVAMLAVGLNAFTPWILAVSGRIPHLIDRQPTLVVLFELYVAMFLVVLTFVLLCRPALDRADPAAARLAAVATVMLFGAMLAIVINGSSSLQPIPPWAPLAVLAASLSATLFAWAAILAAEPQRHRPD